MTKVLLVGEGARENAIAEAITRSAHEPALFAIMKINNPGIAKLCKSSGGEAALGDSLDPASVAKAAEKFRVDMVFIGPEEPQFRGVADELEKRGIACVGAKQGAARVEMSKAFMRKLMWKYNVPGRLRFKSFTNVEDAVAYIQEYAESIALKPARQAGGKGVKVIADLQVYLTSEKQRVKAEHAKDIHDRHMAEYTDIDDKILIEERVEGPEYTLQAFTDGRTVKPLPLVQDNKNAFEMDIGPETGGMGTISGKGLTLPFITQDEYRKTAEIVEEVVKATEKETGIRYKGVIAGQSMLTALWGPTIIEFYSRLGDPEAVNAMPILKTDMIDLMEAIVGECLHKLNLEFEDTATVVKCVSPKGYPYRRDLATGHPVRLDEGLLKKHGCKAYWGSAELKSDGNIITGGSRIVEIFASADSIPEAGERVEKCVPCVSLTDGWGTFHRSDIGSETLLRRRIEQANLIRDVYRYRMGKNLVGVTLDWIPGRGLIKHGYKTTQEDHRFSNGG